MHHLRLLFIVLLLYSICTNVDTKDIDKESINDSKVYKSSTLKSIVEDEQKSTQDDDLLEGQGIISDTLRTNGHNALALMSASTSELPLIRAIKNFPYLLFGKGILNREVGANLVVSYRGFSSETPSSTFLNRTNFLGALVDKLLNILEGIVLNSIGKIRTLYLHNIGMEIFQLPQEKLLGVNDFLALLSSFPDYIDGVYPDAELNSFENEKNFHSSTSRKDTSNNAYMYSFGQATRKLRETKKPKKTIIPNDPYFTSQWAHVDSGNTRWGIESPLAWKYYTGEGTNEASEKIIVALIDSGADYNHPDLKKNIWRNENEICDNGIDDDGNGLIDDCIGWDFFNGDNDPMDDNGHGTASAGIIAGDANNKEGIAGICWNTCNLMLLKTLNYQIKGTVIGFVRAIDYAIGHGARISNNSYGGRGSGFSGLRAAVERAEAAGMIFVAAAGNYQGNNDNDNDPVYPASYELNNILSVAAIRRTGKLADFSSYGKTSVDIAAPGENIFTTESGGGYGSVDGTSFAVPFVTGAVALLWAKEPGLAYTEVIDRIMNSCKPNPYLKGLVRSEGVLDIHAAIIKENQATPRVRQPDGETQFQGCTSDPKACGVGGVCVPGSSDISNSSGVCKCKEGFELINGVCEDVDECKGTPCGEAAYCVNKIGSFECQCKQGYRRIGNSCRDVNECIESPNICPDSAICVNFVGSFDCRCPANAAWNAKKFSQSRCLAIRSPSSGPCVNNGGCGLNSLCKVTGSWWLPDKKCECLEGYVFHYTYGQCVRPDIYEAQYPAYINSVTQQVLPYVYSA